METLKSVVANLHGGELIFIERNIRQIKFYPYVVKFVTNTTLVLEDPYGVKYKYVLDDLPNSEVIVSLNDPSIENHPTYGWRFKN